jgi:hypothetical protein
MIVEEGAVPSAKEMSPRVDSFSLYPFLELHRVSTQPAGLLCFSRFFTAATREVSFILVLNVDKHASHEDLNQRDAMFLIYSM